MAASPVGPDDLDWVLDVLRRRREALASHAAVFWRPAPDADARHRAYVDHLLTDGGARAWRTKSSVLLAAPRGAGWLVDDLHVDERTSDGVDLWTTFAAECPGDEVRLVVPTYETARGEHAVAVGLELVESWWLLELTSGGGEPGVPVALVGADAVTVAAPPVYAPPGPMLFVSSVTNGAVIAAAVEQAPELGCAGVVVNQRTGDAYGPALAGLGFRRHCDFFEGVVLPVDSGAQGR